MLMLIMLRARCPTSVDELNANAMGCDKHGLPNLLNSFLCSGVKGMALFLFKQLMLLKMALQR